jgi:signal peptidase complex subunit 2
MAKKQQKTPPAAAAAAISAVPVVEYEEAETMELLQVDVGDMVKLKQILDETVASTLLATSLVEDYRWDNVKLSIMASACIFAIVAQFSPVPFPESRPLLGVCCCVYFMLSGILQFITTFVDKDCILMTKPLESCKGNAHLAQYGVRVRSNLPRFSEWYSVILEFQGMPSTPHVEQKWSVGQFFDVEGMFDEVGLMQAVEELYKRLEAGKYDDADKKKKE